jgi:P pilus assembly chaperone PapD
MIRPLLGLAALAAAAVPGAVPGAGPAQAQLSVEQAIVDFAENGKRREDIEIVNTGDSTLYVSITPRLVRNPGTESERRVEIANPRELGLLASPGKMVLEPGQRGLMRLSLLQRPQDRDRIFRVAVTPQVGGVEGEGTGVQVVLAYNLLVMARPLQAEAKLQGVRDGDTLTLRNTGDTNALLLQGEQCAPSGAPCRDLPTRRMYAGNSWTLDLPYATQTTWTVRFRDGTRTLTW